MSALKRFGVGMGTPFCLRELLTSDARQIDWESMAARAFLSQMAICIGS